LHVFCNTFCEKICFVLNKKQFQFWNITFIKKVYLSYFLCVDYCRFKTTSSRPIVCRLRAAATTELSSIAIGIVLYFPLIRKLEYAKRNIEISDGIFYEFIMQFLFFICIPIVFSNAMASEGEKYSLAIQFIFLLWIILKILQRAYSFSIIV
jgi:hypothetical protein